MQKHHNSSRSSQFVGEGLSLAELEHHAANWHLDAEVRQFTKGTEFNRKQATKLLLWFLRQREFERCGTVELRAFFAYLNTAHTTDDGRWGNARRKKPLRPAAAKFYYSRLQTFFNFLIEEEVLERSPMGNLKAPIVRQDQIQPFTREQQEALLQVARKTRHPKRDEAIVLFLLDTGARASDLCSLRK